MQKITVFPRGFGEAERQPGTYLLCPISVRVRRSRTPAGDLPFTRPPKNIREMTRTLRLTNLPVHSTQNRETSHFHPFATPRNEVRHNFCTSAMLGFDINYFSPYLSGTYSTLRMSWLSRGCRGFPEVVVAFQRLSWLSRVLLNYGHQPCHSCYTSLERVAASFGL